MKMKPHYSVRVSLLSKSFLGVGSKERPRNGTGTVFCPREIGARAKIRKRGFNPPLALFLSRGNSMPLNPTETLAMQAMAAQESIVCCSVTERATTARFC